MTEYVLLISHAFFQRAVHDEQQRHWYRTGKNDLLSGYNAGVIHNRSTPNGLAQEMRYTLHCRQTVYELPNMLSVLRIFLQDPHRIHFPSSLFLETHTCDGLHPSF